MKDIRLVQGTVLAALFLLSAPARADDGEVLQHRLMVDLAPYSAWARISGDVPDGSAASSGSKAVDRYRGAFAAGLHWEYRPVPFLGVGVRVDIQLPADSPSFLLVLPTLAVRGVLPLLEGRMELWLMAQGGASYLQYGDDFVGYGWSVAGTVGISYAVTPFWGFHFHAGYLQAAANSEGIHDLAMGQGARGFSGVYYKL